MYLVYKYVILDDIETVFDFASTFIQFVIFVLPEFVWKWLHESLDNLTLRGLAGILRTLPNRKGIVSCASGRWIDLPSPHPATAHAVSKKITSYQEI